MLRSCVTVTALSRFDRFAEPSANDWLRIAVAHGVGRERPLPANAAQARRLGLTLFRAVGVRGAGWSSA